MSQMLKSKATKQKVSWQKLKIPQSRTYWCFETMKKKENSVMKKVALKSLGVMKIEFTRYKILQSLIKYKLWNIEPVWERTKRISFMKERMMMVMLKVTIILITNVRQAARWKIWGVHILKRGFYLAAEQTHSPD